jgi:hypothetical protein
MTQTVSSIATLAAALIGRTVISTDNTGVTSNYTIAKLSDKLGTMKSGKKAEYVILQSSDDAAVVMSLHPEAAKRLMMNGSDSGLVLEAADAAAAAEVTAAPAAEAETDAIAEGAIAATEPAAPVAKVKKAKAPKVAKVKAEKPAKVAKVKAEKPAADAVAKAPSKKDQFMAVFTANVGKTRQEVKTAAESLGLSLAGFNTYYQNAKSGKWA